MKSYSLPELSGIFKIKQGGIFLFLLLTLTPLINFNSFGQTCPSPVIADYETDNNNGSWFVAGDWDSSPPPASWISGATLTIPTGVVVLITSPSFDLLNYNLVVEGVLVIDGKLALSAGYSITIQTGAILCCGGQCNASEKLSIGGVPIWNGSEGSVPGFATSNGGPLPVELLFFKAFKKDQSISLEWATATERDADYYAIEKSANGKDFTEIGREKAAGNSIFRKDYSFADNLPLLGRSYYRLKQVDFNGNFEYFNITFVDVQGVKTISVHPNPIVDNTLQLHLNFSIEDPISAKIYNSTGALVKAFSFSGTSFKGESNLRSGTYLLKVQAGREHFTQRFVIP